MTARYVRLVGPGEGCEGPHHWVEFVPDESIRPNISKHGGGEPTRKVCAPPIGYRRDKNGALHLTKWRPPNYRTDIEQYRLPDGPEEDDPMPGTPTPATDKVPRRPLTNGQPSPDPPSKNPFGKKPKPSTPEAGFGANLTAAEKREQKARREAAAARSARESDEILARAIKEARAAAAGTPPPAIPAKVAPPSGMTVQAAIKLLHHDPDYLGDIELSRLHDLLGIPEQRKYHPRIRREIKKRSKAA